jgi:hypothetical protein
MTDSTGVVPPSKCPQLGILFVGLLLLLCFTGTLLSRADEKSAEPFPMSPGTYWIYRGIVRWTNEANESSETKLEWKTQVSHALHHGAYSAAVINGFPSELNWSTGKPEPADSLLVRSPGDKFYWIAPEQTKSALSRFANQQDSLQGLLQDDDLFLQLPLTKGKKFCDPEEMNRDDDMYCWMVESAERVSLNVKGVSSPVRLSYTIRYATNPDDIEYEFVPGICLTSYAYHHHGTVADTELTLAEFHPASSGHE